MIIGCIKMNGKIENIAAYNLDRYLSRYRDGLLIIDVRSEREYREGHISEAINIPYEDFLKRDIKLENNRKVLVYCSRGGRSVRVARMLLYKGYDVVNVVGGLKEYNGKNIVK
jgi:rhodanese-related sulfurtransferase